MDRELRGLFLIGFWFFPQSGRGRTGEVREFQIGFALIGFVVEEDFAPIGSGRAGWADKHGRTSMGTDRNGAYGEYGYGTSVSGVVGQVEEGSGTGEEGGGSAITVAATRATFWPVTTVWLREAPRAVRRNGKGRVTLSGPGSVPSRPATCP